MGFLQYLLILGRMIVVVDEVKYFTLFIELIKDVIIFARVKLCRKGLIIAL